MCRAQHTPGRLETTPSRCSDRAYDISPSTDVWATLNYGISRTQNTPAQGNSSKNGMTMRCDNAFLYQTFGGTGFGLNGASQLAH